MVNDVTQSLAKFSFELRTSKSTLNIIRSFRKTSERLSVSKFSAFNAPVWQKSFILLVFYAWIMIGAKK